MHVLIAGGGIGGLTAALALARAGHQIELFEQATEFVEAGAGIQLSPNASRVLHFLGLQEALNACAFIPTATQFRHWRSGTVISQRPLGTTVTSHYGSPYYHVHRGDLLRLLVNAAQQTANIALHTNARLTGYSQNGSQVQVAVNGQLHQGDVLVGADGIHSEVRQQLWGAQAASFTGNIAWRALVPTARLADGLIRPMSTVWWGPNKHFVHYYVRGGTYVNCVCVVEKPGWETESWAELGEHNELKADFAGWHSDIQQLIDAADSHSLYKWALHDRPPMSRWSKGCVTLLGDACHSTLPFMAQGAAMAIEDSAVLANCLSQGHNIETSLQYYEQLRRPRTTGIQQGSRRNAKVFHLSGISAWLRNRAANRAGAGAMDRLFSYNALEIGLEAPPPFEPG